MNWLDLLKRAAEVIGATAVIYGAVAGYTAATGGHLPPWFTFADAQAFEKAQDATNKAVQDNLDLLTLERLRDEVKAADAKVAKDPQDTGAQGDKWFAQKKLEIFFKAHPALAEQMH